MSTKQKPHLHSSKPMKYYLGFNKESADYLKLHVICGSQKTGDSCAFREGVCG